MCNCIAKPKQIIPQKRVSDKGVPIVQSVSKNFPAPKDGDLTKFCRKCYFKIIRIQKMDPTNRFIIEKYSCSNPNCPLYSPP